jgi:hypothetical protein
LFRYYHQVEHDLDPIDDKGYFSVYYEYHDRLIFVCKHQVGRSKAFIQEFDIRYYVDLIPTRDLAFVDESPRRREMFYNLMKWIVAEIAGVHGNVCVYCYNGRSRSPAFVAAYMMTVACYTQKQVYDMLSYEFVPMRGDDRGVDIDKRFVPYLKSLEMEFESL